MRHATRRQRSERADPEDAGRQVSGGTVATGGTVTGWNNFRGQQPFGLARRLFDDVGAAAATQLP